MLRRIQCAIGLPQTRPVFVIGTGRSGTHWLGNTLANHPELRTSIEERPMFQWSTQMALNPALERKLYSRLVRAYKWQLLRTWKRLYLDKTHPNIWLAENLKTSFPRSLFLGIERNPYATVASMINHPGVSAWHERWREFSIPNRFLGITIETAKVYDDTPLASRCAMRWVAHHNRMKELKHELGDSLMVVAYEEFAHNTKSIIDRLGRFLELRDPIQTPKVKIDSLTKWKHNLSLEEVEQVHNIVGIHPNAVDYTQVAS